MAKCSIRQVYTEKEIGLPDKYQEVQYLESTGAQYINLGITGKSGLNVTLDYEPTAVNTNQAIFGSIKSNAQRYTLRISSSAYYELQFWSQYGASSTKAVVGTRSSVEVNFVYNDGYLKVDGTTVQTRTGGSGTSDVVWYMFARHNGSNVDNYAKIKLYSATIKDNGKVIRNFIPCYRKSDNVAGLFDMIEYKFYTNQGTGADFTLGPDVGTLPSRFQQVEYIQSSGTQYIDTAWELDTVARFGSSEMEIKATHTGSNITLTGVCDDGTYWCMEVPNTYPTYIRCFNGNGSSYTDKSGLHSDNITPDTIIYTMDGTTAYFVINGTQYSSSRTNNVHTYDTTYTVFARKLFEDTTSIQQYATMRLYYLKYRVGGVLERDFVPCYALESVTAYQGATETTAATGTAGLYDLVNGRFYINSGTGTFTVGPIV